jgi:SAM-dependent methyltransferase
MSINNYIETAGSYILQPSKRKLIKIAKGLSAQKGLEIGGPSLLFGLRGYFPVYIFAKQIDGVNFSNETVWEGALNEGENYKYFHGKIGYQYIAEATNLSKIADNSYDFILSCHSLEHVANPIKAIKEWNRVLKPGGSFVLVLPDKEFTFDVNRPYTTLQHLVDDYEKNLDEKDTTHFEEVIRLHDLSKDTGVKTKEELESRALNNFSNRCVHHHVFSLSLMKELLEYCGFSIIRQQKGEPFHLITVAEKREV